MLLAILGGVLALAVASGPGPQEPPPPVAYPQADTPDPAGGGPSDDVLTIRAVQEVFTLDAASGSVARRLPPGILAPDRSVVYDALPVGSAAGGQTRWETMVRAVDVRTGRVLRRKALEGKYVLPWVDSTGPGGLSPDGQWLVLQAEPEQASPSQTPPDLTRFVVLDTALTRAPRHVVLDGVFSFDAVDNAASALFLIEYLSSPDGSEMTPYRVRFYDLVADRLDPAIIADKRNAEQVMTGQRFKTLASPDGQWLYSLYLNNHHGPFIHVLNLGGRYAFCIDLPDTAKMDGSAQAFWSLLPAPGGRTLYAVNGALGLVALVDTVDLRVQRVIELQLPRADAPSVPARIAAWLVPTVHAKGLAAGGAALSPDGRTLWLAGRQGLLVVDTGSWTVRDTYLPDRTLADVASSPDGARLYAVSVDGEEGSLGHLVQLDPAGGRLVADVAAIRLFSAIIRVESRPAAGR